jgi:hypothetical protein
MLFIPATFLNFQKYSVVSRNLILRRTRAKFYANWLTDGYETVARDKKKSMHFCKNGNCVRAPGACNAGRKICTLRCVLCDKATSSCLILCNFRFSNTECMPFSPLLCSKGWGVVPGWRLGFFPSVKPRSSFGYCCRTTPAEIRIIANYSISCRRMDRMRQHREKPAATTAPKCARHEYHSVGGAVIVVL